MRRLYQPEGVCGGFLHGWGKPSHYYTTLRCSWPSIVVAGLAPAMFAGAPGKNPPHTPTRAASLPRRAEATSTMLATLEVDDDTRVSRTWASSSSLALRIPPPRMRMFGSKRLI